MGGWPKQCIHMWVNVKMIIKKNPMASSHIRKSNLFMAKFHRKLLDKHDHSFPKFLGREMSLRGSCAKQVLFYQETKNIFN
jgi:hypothetical protein